jgi:hypothetical protein
MCPESTVTYVTGIDPEKAGSDGWNLHHFSKHVNLLINKRYDSV